MSIAEHSTSSELGRISLGRRVFELLQEKGEAFSIRAFAERIGINRETLRRMLVGERPFSPSNLEQISSGLGMTIERLKQMDTLKQEKELAILLKANKRTKIMMLRAHELATGLVDVAKGMTERGISLTQLGRVQYNLQQYDEAHDTWLSALTFAEVINQEYGDSDLLYHVTSFLMLSYTVRKEYTNILRTLTVVEEAFVNDSEKMGYVHYTRMKWHEHRGNVEQAKNHAYIGLDHFKQTNDNDQIGKALINVAHFEFLMGNYLKAKEALESAIENLRLFDYFYLLAIKEYAKTLLKLDDKATAREVISENLELAKEYPEFYGKLRIMYSMVLDDPTFSVDVISDLNMNVAVRNFACKQLMNYYSSKDDSESVMRYYKLAQSLLKTKGQFFENEEEF